MGARQRRRARPAGRDVLDRYQVKAPKTWPELTAEERRPWAPRPPESITVKEVGEGGEVVKKRRRVAA